MNLLDLLPHLATGVTTGLVGWLSGRGSLKVAKVQAEASPYAALAERVVALEHRVETLEAERLQDRQWITRTIFRAARADEVWQAMLRPWPEWCGEDAIPDFED